MHNPLIKIINLYCDATAECRKGKAVVANQRESKRVSVDTDSEQQCPLVT
jgi:hypothetical protein